jgi:hypothetical protein
MIVDVDILNIKLYQLFVVQLMEQNIGYNYNRVRLQQMIDIVQMIDYIQNGNPSKKEIQKIINIYA